MVLESVELRERKTWTARFGWNSAPNIQGNNESEPLGRLGDRPNSLNLAGSEAVRLSGDLLLR